jgi:hypothetical protein
MDLNKLSYERNQRYYRERHCSGQWRDFLCVLVDELQDNMGRSDTADFFNAIGQKLATRFSLAEQDTVEELEERLNSLWLKLDWGWCQLIAQPNSITIIHGAWPNPDEGKETLWPIVFSSVLQGFYSKSLSIQGGDASVKIEIKSSTLGMPIELIYGA